MEGCKSIAVVLIEQYMHRKTMCFKHCFYYRLSNVLDAQNKAFTEEDGSATPEILAVLMCPCKENKQHKSTFLWTVRWRLLETGNIQFTKVVAFQVGMYLENTVIGMNIINWLQSRISWGGGGGGGFFSFLLFSFLFSLLLNWIEQISEGVFWPLLALICCNQANLCNLVLHFNEFFYAAYYLQICDDKKFTVKHFLKVRMMYYRFTVREN